MMLDEQQGDMREIAREYFRRLDVGDEKLFDLFSEDAQIYFPKFGFGKGRAALIEILTGLGGLVEVIEHDVRGFLYTVSGNVVVVEGTTKGKLKSGESWSAGETPGGRFCNVFEIHDGLIKRLNVYLDPDYAGKHEASFLWGREGRQW